MGKPLVERSDFRHVEHGRRIHDGQLVGVVDDVFCTHSHSCEQYHDTLCMVCFSCRHAATFISTLCCCPFRHHFEVWILENDTKRDTKMGVVGLTIAYVCLPGIRTRASKKRMKELCATA